MSSGGAHLEGSEPDLIASLGLGAVEELPLAVDVTAGLQEGRPLFRQPCVSPRNSKLAYQLIKSTQDDMLV